MDTYAMHRTLGIPEAMVAYAEWFSVAPEEYAQFTLDEKGRDCAERLLFGHRPKARGSRNRNSMTFPRS